MRKYVNRSLFLATLGILLGFSSTSVFAQIATKVAYTDESRNKIYVKNADGSTEVLFPKEAIPVTNIELIGSTTDGKSILVAGNFNVQTPQISFTGPALVRIDSPFSLNVLQPNFQVLFTMPWLDNAKADQIGVITPDNQHWYFTWVGSSEGGDVGLQFYHGPMYPSDQSPLPKNVQIDSLPGDQVPLRSGEFHMSSMASSLDGNSVYAISVDQLDNSSGLQHIYYHKWRPGSSPVTPQEFSSQFSANPFKYQNLDSAMGFAMVQFPTDDKNVAMAFVNPDGDLDFRRFTVGTGNPKFDPNSNTGIIIPRSALPDSLIWFRGSEFGVIPPHAYSPGTGGDISFSKDKDKFLVTVHEANPDSLKARKRFSQIWEVDLNTHTAKQVINDPTINERLPKYFYYDQHTPVKVDSGYVSIGVSSLDFGVTDTGKTVTKQITVTNPSGRAVTLNSATVTGAGFSIVSNSKGINPPFTVGIEESVNFNIAFKPTTGGNANGTFTVKFASSNDSTRSASLTGVGNIPVDGVRLTNAAAVDLTASPNPFKQSTLITLTVQETGNTTFEVTDVMGRVVFSAPVVKLAKGESRSFEFNAQQLNVPAGIYHVSAVSAGQTLTRQIVYVK